MQCKAITNSGKQCSRKALPNSNYCWQHQNQNITTPKNITTPTKENKTTEIKNSTLTLNALQPGIMSNIIKYSGTLGNFSKTFSENNKRNILKQWFIEIKVQTSFSEVKEYEIPLLWVLYQNRISNAPARNLLDKAIRNGLNFYYFHSKVIDYEYTIEELPLYFSNAQREQKNLDIINEKVLEESINLRKGDLIFLDQYISNIHSEFPPFLIFNGSNLEWLDYKFINAYTPSVPTNILINDYPVANYFSNSLSNVVYFDTTDTKVQLIQEYKGKVTKYITYKIYHYITTGKYADYEIWMYVELNDENFKWILSFDDANSGLGSYDVFLATINEFIDDADIMTQIYDKIIGSNNLKMLFQNDKVKYYSY